MKPLSSLSLCVLFLVSCFSAARAQQNQNVKFVTDTLIVEAEGTYETDPDVAILTFDVTAEDKELKSAYAKASQSMNNIVGVAQRNGLAKEAIQTGVLTITPYYDSPRMRRAKSYTVQGHVILKVQDFAKVGPMMDDAMQDGIVDFRSLSYSLVNEEAAKKKAVADAMQRAEGRAAIALEQTHQKLGAARFVNLEVHNMVGVAQIQNVDILGNAETTSGGGFFSKARKSVAPPPPPVPVQPGKITITATVQCMFQIQ